MVPRFHLPYARATPAAIATANVLFSSKQQYPTQAIPSKHTWVAPCGCTAAFHPQYIYGASSSTTFYFYIQSFTSSTPKVTLKNLQHLYLFLISSLRFFFSFLFVRNYVVLRRRLSRSILEVFLYDTRNVGWNSIIITLAGFSQSTCVTIPRGLCSNFCRWDLPTASETNFLSFNRRKIRLGIISLCLSLWLILRLRGTSMQYICYEKVNTLIDAMRPNIITYLVCFFFSFFLS